MALRTSPGFWALSLGAVGFAAGFLGPIYLNPDANQGPLLGLFITGPGGALAGAVLGFCFRYLPFTDAIRAQALALCCLTLLAGTLWIALPEPARRAEVIDARIERCRRAAELVPAALAHWDQRLAQTTWSPPRAHWRGDVERMVRDQRGVVVDLGVARSNQILEHRRPWNRGALSAQGWRTINDSRRYFAGGTCDSYPLGRHVRLAPVSTASMAWPPDDLPLFLGVQVLEPVPAKYARLMR